MTMRPLTSPSKGTTADAVTFAQRVRLYGRVGRGYGAPAGAGDGGRVVRRQAARPREAAMIGETVVQAVAMLIVAESVAVGVWVVWTRRRGHDLPASPGGPVGSDGHTTR